MKKPYLMIFTQMDARYGQLIVLTGLLVYGLLELHFSFSPWYPVVTIATALTVQFFFTRRYRLSAYEWRSALITALSLILLLRSDHPAWGMAAASLAVAVKFMLRWRGKSIFNPSNLALSTMLIATPHCWLSPGQWGAPVVISGFAAALAWMILSRVDRIDITLAFLSFYAAGLFGRAWWLGDPMAIPLHQILQGSLLIFAFFMISDPKTTPNRRSARIGFAFLVAAFALYGRFSYYEPNALIYALTLCSPLVPCFDRFFPAAAFRWTDSSSSK
ncbi:MAG: RnfABCDGE type electron transport complex subunit D [Gammaproteobacteria bacterium]